jgi:hypothetical protein
VNRLAGYIFTSPALEPQPRVARMNVLTITGIVHGVGTIVAKEGHSPVPLRAVRSGRTYKVTTPAARALVAPELAAVLETVLERFAHRAGFTPGQPLQVGFTRGYEAGSHGHREGRAADIVSVAGQSVLQWKRQWDDAVATACGLPSAARATASAVERMRNVGYRLYKALQAHDGWRVDEHGWRPYRGMIQLFGPWTSTEGPWKAIKPTDAESAQRVADQAWVFRAHQDHIHVAR